MTARHVMGKLKSKAEFHEINALELKSRLSVFGEIYRAIFGRNAKTLGAAFSQLDDLYRSGEQNLPLKRVHR